MSLDFNPYHILAIPQTATVEEIRDAYRRAARRLHPDKNRHPGAVSQFQDITRANDVLTDESARRKIDRQLADNKEDDDHLLLMRVTPSKRYVQALKEPQVVYLLVEIMPDPRSVQGTEAEVQDARLNLTLVIDRSNSMNGVRLDKVKQAAHQIIDQLKPDDILSVVTFNDFAEVLIDAAPMKDKSMAKARVSLMGAKGGTEILTGLVSGLEQTRRYLAPKLVNHVILLTDGHTYGDAERALAVARAAAEEGITISAMGIGEEWNDAFLDQLTSSSGGSVVYVKSPGTVVRFLNEHVRSLSKAYAEHVQLSVAPDSDVTIELGFKLAPNSQPLVVNEATIQLGSLPYNRIMSVVFQLEVPPMEKEGFRSLMRIVASGDVLKNHEQRRTALSDISIGVSNDEALQEQPPAVLLEALGKLTLYRMQERAREALERGDIVEATRQLEILATRLLEAGEDELAKQAHNEAKQVRQTKSFSEQGSKILRYQTRYLIAPSDEV